MKKCTNPRCWSDCPDPGLNQGPVDLQSHAFPTELSRPVILMGRAQKRVLVVSCSKECHILAGPFDSVALKLEDRFQGMYHGPKMVRLSRIKVLGLKETSLVI